MSTKYRFSINSTSVDPIYSGSLAKEYTLESGQLFYRQRVPENFIFVKDDFDWLDGQSFDTEFVLLIESSTDNGATWDTYWTGQIFKTDGDWDDDNKRVVFSAEVQDEYTNVLAGKDKEFNLIKLAPAKTEVEIQKRPLIQLYIPGDSVVSCFLSGNYWEQDVAFEEDDTTELINTYHFSLASTIYKILVTGTGTPAECKGEYVSKTLVSEYSGKNDVYYIDLVFSGGQYTFLLKRTSDDATMFTSGNYVTIPSSFSFTGVTGTGTLSGDVSTIEVYTRLLTDVLEVGGVATEDIPAEDLVAYNRNYRKIAVYDEDLVEITPNTQTDPTEYGLSEDGEYFVQPYTTPKGYPIARSTWGLSSIWFYFAPSDYTKEEEARKPYIAKDISKIEDVISVLLGEIDSSITHEGTSTYSQFLYGTNPLTSAVFRVMLTQKSNMTAGEYDKPAQKAPITLETVFSMLRDVFQCYWYIEDSKLKIEHISWFKNGGAYTGSPLYAADLTTLTQPKNQKTWGFGSNKYSYDKEELAEQFQFSWMDDVTFAFEGYPIGINSKFVLQGKVEDIIVGNFNPDVDYMLLSPEAINPDGFALLGVTIDDNNLFDSSDTDVELGRTISPSTGNTSLNLSYNTTGYMPVVPGSRYWRSYYRYLAFFDYDKNYVSGISPSDDMRTFTVPEGCFYVRCDVSTAAWTSYEFIKGSTGDGMQVLPFWQKVVEDYNIIMQNGYLSWINLHPSFWLYDMPAEDITVNNVADTAEGVKRTRKQKVYFPSEEDIDPMKLIKTDLGDGQIERINVNLSSRMNEITLKYDTE